MSGTSRRADPGEAGGPGGAVSPASPLRRLAKRYGAPAAIIAICGVVYVGCALLRARQHLEWLELWAYDRVVRAQAGGRAAPFSDDVVVVGITEQDLRDLHHYPLTDREKADLFDRLTRAGARAIGSDVYMDLPTAPGTTDDQPDEGRRMLREALARDRNVVCAEVWGSGKGDTPDIPPPPFVKPGRRVGFVDFAYDRDDVLRRGLLYFSRGPVAGGVPGDGPKLRDRLPEPSLSLDVANKFLEGEGTLKQDFDDPLHLERFWPSRIPRFAPTEGPYVRAEDAGYQYLINYAGPVRFRRYSLHDVTEGKAGPGAFAGKAVLVGMTAESVKDKVNMPIGLEVYGVEHHALLVDRLIRTARGRGAPVRATARAWGAVWTLLWTLLAGAAGSRLRQVLRIALVAAGGLLVIAATAVFAMRFAWWVPVVPPALCWLVALAAVTAYMVQLESADRSTVMELFGKLVQKEVAQEIWSRRDELLEQGALRARTTVATLMFADLEGFTTLSEKMEPAELIEWLNGYLKVMTDLVVARHGIVAKYMGDGIMVVFGSPLTRSVKGDAGDAVECALDMRGAMGRLRREWLASGKPCPRMRIGIYTGTVVSGSVGSAQRSEYTTLGDTTNTASRLESFDKDLMDADIVGGDDGCRILIGETTWQLVEDRVRARPIGEVRVKGRDEHVPVYGVIDRVGAAPDVPADTLRNTGTRTDRSHSSPGGGDSNKGDEHAAPGPIEPDRNAAAPAGVLSQKELQ